jgi:hypothetical protein
VFATNATKDGRATKIASKDFSAKKTTEGRRYVYDECIHLRMRVCVSVCVCKECKKDVTPRNASKYASVRNVS